MKMGVIGGSLGVTRRDDENTVPVLDVPVMEVHVNPFIGVKRVDGIFHNRS